MVPTLAGEGVVGAAMVAKLTPAAAAACTPLYDATTTTLPAAAAANHVGGAAYEHVPTPDALGAEHVTDAVSPPVALTAAVTARPGVLTVHAPELVVSTYVSRSVSRST